MNKQTKCFSAAHKVIFIDNQRMNYIQNWKTYFKNNKYGGIEDDNETRNVTGNSFSYFSEKKDNHSLECFLKAVTQPIHRNYNFKHLSRSLRPPPVSPINCQQI